MNFKVLFVFSTLFLLGCSNPGEDYQPKSKFKGPVYVNQIGPLEKLLDKAILPRASRSEYESIGIVSMVVEGNPLEGEFSNGQCTGFLLRQKNGNGEQLVVTNAHCITKVVKENKSRCGDFLGIRLPQSQGLSAETKMCKQLHYVSESIDENLLIIGEDLAVFSISPTTRNGFEVSDQSVTDEDSIQVFKVDPIAPKELGGSFSLAKCRVTMNSTLLQEFTSAEYVAALGTMSLESATQHNNSEEDQCFIVNGNSGSPVIDERGFVVGVAQSYYSNRFLELIESIELGVQLMAGDYIQYRFPETVPKHIHFSQIKCLDFSSDGISQGSCVFEQNEDLTTESVLENLKDEAKEVITDEYLMGELSAKLLGLNPPWIESEVRKLDDFAIEVSPVCHRLESKDLDSLEEIVRLKMVARGRLVVYYNQLYVADEKHIEEQFTEEEYSVRTSTEEFERQGIVVHLHSRSLFMPFDLPSSDETSESPFPSHQEDKIFPADSESKPTFSLKRCAE